MAIEYPSFDPASGKPVFSPDNGKPAKDCTPPEEIPCDDCKNHGPITATITTTGGCDTAGTDCDYECDNDVVSVADNGGANWFGDTGYPVGGGNTYWSVEVDCTADVWTITVEGGCHSDTNFGGRAKWTARVFTPDACQLDGGGPDGYPTHSGIALGDPDTNGDCWIDCQPTVALS